MNYWKAKTYFDVAVRFEKLAMEYWEKLPKQMNRHGIGKLRYQDTEESFDVRMKISHLLPLIEEAASSLGVSYFAQSYPAPAIGGPVLPVNILRSVIDPEIGHAVIDRNLIIDTMVKTKVVAERECRNQFIHMLLPWNWVIDLCAFIIRFPFLILRRAGLPPSVEENIIAQAVKIIGTVILITFLTYKGISLAGVNLGDIIPGLLK